jgi:hypothetical protein
MCIRDVRGACCCKLDLQGWLAKVKSYLKPCILPIFLFFNMKIFVIVFFFLVAFSFVSCLKKMKTDKHYSFSLSKPINSGFQVVVTSSAVFIYENPKRTVNIKLTVMKYRLKNNPFVEETNDYIKEFRQIYDILDGNTGPIIVGESVADSEMDSKIKIKVLSNDTYHLLEPAVSSSSIIKSRVVPGTDDFFVHCFDSNKNNEILSWYNQKLL